MTEPASGGITLTATGYKVKGVQKADLAWAGATSVDVRRSDKGGLERVITSGVSGSTYTDNIGKKGKGTYDYRVCEAGDTSVCSNVARVTFG